MSQKTPWSFNESSALAMICSDLNTPTGGVVQWAQVAAIMKASGHNRTSKQCRQRWNHVILTKKTLFTPEQDEFLTIIVNKFGTIWSAIVKCVETFKGTSATQLRNRYSSLKRIRGGCVRRLSFRDRAISEVLLLEWLESSFEAKAWLARCRGDELECSDTETAPYLTPSPPSSGRVNVVPMLGSRALSTGCKRKSYKFGRCFEAITDTTDSHTQQAQPTKKRIVKKTLKRRVGINAVSLTTGPMFHAIKVTQEKQPYSGEKRNLDIAMFSDGKLKTLSNILMDTSSYLL